MWSPLVKDTIASGSDDATVRVWKMGEKGHMTLSGHTSNVRALTWNTEVPWMLLSGAWDGSIRVWDTRSGTCVYEKREHCADVYSLSSHPMRPFSFISSSRDTSIRLWVSYTSSYQDTMINFIQVFFRLHA